MPPISWKWGSGPLVLGAVLFLATPAQAHNHLFWPQTPGCYGRLGEPATWTYVWGHPFEMTLDDAPAGLKFAGRSPHGKREPVLLKEIRLKDQVSNQDRRGYKVSFSPASPGDYYLTLEAPPCFISEEKVYYQDYVKGIWHVHAEKGWDEPLGLEVEIVPLTRPYGWPAGSAFTGKALFKGNALKLAPVEVEKLTGHFVPPEQRPKDRFGEENGPLISRTAKTDANGYFTVTLDSPGWWVLTVSRQDGRLIRDGKPYPVDKRGCLFIHMEVPPAAPASPGK
jgi:cobalt/nickel transport protein